MLDTEWQILNINLSLLIVQTTVRRGFASSPPRLAASLPLRCVLFQLRVPSAHIVQLVCCFILKMGLARLPVGFLILTCPS